MGGWPGFLSVSRGVITSAERPTNHVFEYANCRERFTASSRGEQLHAPADLHPGKKPGTTFWRSGQAFAPLPEWTITPFSAPSCVDESITIFRNVGKYYSSHTASHSIKPESGHHLRFAVESLLGRYLESVAIIRPQKECLLRTHTMNLLVSGIMTQCVWLRHFWFRI